METANQIILYIAILFLILAFLFAMSAALFFKKILLKLVALEVMVNLFISGIGVWILFIHFPFLLDVSIALSLIMFLSTAAYCQFIHDKGDQANV